MDGAIDFVGGTIGGVVTVLVGQSLDTVKVKMQTFPQLYKSAYGCFVDTFREGGIRALYAGTVPSMAANVAENSVLFACYGTCQRCIMTAVGKKKDTDLTIMENGAAGGTAAFFAALVLCPTELVKCKMQAAHEMRQQKIQAGVDPTTLPRTKSAFRWVRDVYKQEGLFRGFYKGIDATMLREIPGYFCFFLTYDYLRSYFAGPGGDKDSIGMWRTIVAGGSGGAVLWTLIFPFDVIKSRIQVLQKPGVPTPNFVAVARDIVKENGVGGLYRGLGPTLVRTFPATGALFFSYEATKKTARYAFGSKYATND